MQSIISKSNYMILNIYYNACIYCSNNIQKTKSDFYGTYLFKLD